VSQRDDRLAHTTGNSVRKGTIRMAGSNSSSSSNNNNSRDFGRRSSAVTLSDMEVFIFPGLMYGLMLANIMSPRIWRWLDDPWFDGLDTMKPYRRITRLKQYIMDHYLFNLDLDTWGLTTTEREIDRFSGHISEEALSQSNALFGYEGDKYYFDIDIRTHFGLDAYTGNVIPYWKTETVEAMDAFRYKPDYPTGAGECVSLAALYAAALFIVARVPLEDIYMMATPLHSQNYIDLGDGILTNNRRLVTKNMWYNGTALSAQARRALENERVTIVTHESGYIHTLFDEATIDRDAYDHFAERLRGYLTINPTDDILGNWLRQSRDRQKCFQVRWSFHGREHYIGAERAFAYEDDVPWRLTDKTRARLMDEIDHEEFRHTRYEKRIVLNDLEEYFSAGTVDVCDPDDVARLKIGFASDCMDAEAALEAFVAFCHVAPQLPDARTKEYVDAGESLGIDLEMGREEIIARLEDIRAKNQFADLAFSSYRDLSRIESGPFLAAAIDRSPVSLEGARDLDQAALFDYLAGLPEESIYDEPGRLAQPDEVWNYRRGDGIERAITMATILRGRGMEGEMTITVGSGEVVLRAGGEQWAFATSKGLDDREWSVPERSPSPAPAS